MFRAATSSFLDVFVGVFCIWLSLFCFSVNFYFLALLKGLFGDYFLLFLGFLSKSKIVHLTFDPQPFLRSLDVFAGSQA